MLLHWPRALHSLPLPAKPQSLPYPHPFRAALFAHPFPLCCSHYSHFPFALFMRHNTWPWRNAHCIWAEAGAAAAKTFGCPDCSLVAVDVLLSQQIKIASFCPAQCKSCLVMPASGWGQFNARHLINCPVDGQTGRGFNEMPQRKPKLLQSPFTAVDWRRRRDQIIYSHSKISELKRCLKCA